MFSNVAEVSSAYFTWLIWNTITTSLNAKSVSMIKENTILNLFTQQSFMSIAYTTAVESMVG